MNTFINHRIYILLILLFLCKTGKAAEPFRFIHYEIENGLSSNTVRSLCQDYQGFMWFGTENGLNRFDGQNIKAYRKEADNPESIGNNYIFALFEDTRKNFWVGTDEGVYLYNRTIDSFTPFMTSTPDGKVISGQITSIQEDKYGNIWIASLQEGIYSYHPDSKQIKFYNCFTTDTNQLFNGKIYNIFIDSEGYLWICGQLGGTHLYRYDQLTGEFEIFNIDTPLNDPGFFSFTIAEDHSNILWLGTWNNGIWKLNRKTGKIQSFLTPGTPEGISHIHSIIQYKPGILLIGSDDGLTVFNTITYEAETMRSSEFHKNSLSNNFVYPLYVDKEGGLWVGTYYGGINYAAPYSGAIKGYSHSEFTNSVSGQIISCFCEDDKGNIWIGSDDGGLSSFNPSTNRFVNYLPETGKNSLSYHNVHSIVQDGEYLWIGTYSGGLNKLHIPTQKFTYYLSDRSQVKRAGDSSIYTLFIDHTDSLWVGTMSGICRYNRETDNFIPVIDAKTMVIAALEDKSHQLWFASLGNGIYKYNKQTGEWKHYEHNKENPNSLISDQVTSLYIGNDDILWIGTEEGLCCMNTREETFRLIPIANEYRLVTKIIGDENYLWITTNKGLYRFNPEDNTFRHFSKQDGLQNDQFCNNSGIRSQNGLLYLGTINGFNIINPRSIYVNRYIPPVVLTNLQIFNQDATPDLYPSILSGSIHTTEQIQLSHKENVFSIEFASLSYTIPSKNQYKYILEGFDKNWNEVGNERKATYTNLPAGKYTFRVQGSNNDGIWNEKGTTLTIIIHPPYWRSTIAYILYIVILVTLLTLLFLYFRKQTEKKQQARTQQLNEEKERELHEAKINFFTMIAHEIRTPVSLIIGPLEKIMSKSELLPAFVQGDIKIIERNGFRLLSLVNQLLDFRKAEEGAFVINYTQTDLAELVRNVYERFHPLADVKGLKLSLTMPDRKLNVTIDPEAITKVISNLLTNAIKYARSGITLSIQSGKNTFTIRVKDDGKGIPSTELKDIFLPFYQSSNGKKAGTGLGLSLVKSLTELHEGMVEVDSEQNSYCEFVVTIPIKPSKPVSIIQTERPETTISPELIYNDGTGMNENISHFSSHNTETGHIPTLLIVEDHTDMRNFLCEMLEPFYNIILAENGVKGMNELEKHPIDLILSDVMMPEMDGVTLCQKVKENIHFCHIPLILLTAKTDNRSKLQGIQGGADAYLEKPFSPQILQAMITNLLATREQLRKRFTEIPLTPLHSVAGNQADKQFLSKLNAIIEENISNENFTIEILAEELNISRSGLFSKLKQLVDMTPNVLIQLIRLKKAAELLATRQYRINEICYQVGFNNPSYFTKCFQKQFGMLPKEFMNKYSPDQKESDKKPE